MLPSLNTGISGLNSNSLLMSIIGNNIANINTVGYKECAASFAEVLSQSLSGSTAGSQVGRGVKTTQVSPIFTQSALETTQSATDLAISGDGFFVVRNPESDSYFYTRAGNFNFNKDGNLVTPESNILQGWAINDGQIEGAFSDINLSGFSFTPSATTKVTMNINLDARADVLGVAFDKTRPVATSNYSATSAVYDSLGNTHNVTVYFTKTGDNTWNWNVVVPTADIDTAAATAASTSGDDGTNPLSGTLTFNTDGSFPTDGSGITITRNENFYFANGATPAQTINFDFLQTSQYGSVSNINSMSQDGYGSGNLVDIKIDIDGLITGISTNKNVQELAKISIATFQSPAGLTKKGDNLFEESQDSGNPIISQTVGGNVGNIMASALESSNVDLGAQFMKMIVVQRAYQANARVITTSDQLLNEVVNLKR
ncbi:MAG: flagellar hook protein FlgE [bacterium]